MASDTSDVGSAQRPAVTETSPAESLTSTLELLTRFRGGDHDAINELIARYSHAVTMHARGRLPGGARSLLETQDLVQNAFVRVVNRLRSGGFEYRGEGSFLWYVCRAVTNSLADVARDLKRNPTAVPLEDVHPDAGLSPLEAAVGQERHAALQRALSQLDDSDQLLIFLRFELGYNFKKIAAMTDKPSADAARMGVVRAIAALKEAAGHGSRSAS